MVREIDRYCSCRFPSSTHCCLRIVVHIHPTVPSAINDFEYGFAYRKTIHPPRSGKISLQHIIVAYWRIYASRNWVIIASHYGLLPIWHHAIIRISDYLQSIWQPGWYFNEIIFERNLALRSRKFNWKCRLQLGGHFITTPMSEHRICQVRPTTVNLCWSSKRLHYLALS